jgi:O-antigen/teichoic acid export membrane protein
LSLFKKLAGQTALYGLSSMLVRAVNFLLLPFYVAILSPAEFGVMTELYSHVALLNIIYLMGMETAYFRFSNRKDANETDIFNTSESLLLTTSIIFSGLLILFSQPLASLLDHPDKRSYIIWLAIILAADAIVAIPFARLRLKNLAGKFAFIKIFNIFLYIFLNLFFLVFCRKIYDGTFLVFLKPVISHIYLPDNDVAYVFLSNLIANVLIIPIFWQSFRTLRFRLNKELLHPMLLYAYPLIFMGLAGMVNESFSRIILRKILPDGFYSGRTSSAALGIFGACYRLSVVMNLAIQSFRYAAEPFFFSQAPDKNAPEVFAKIMKWFIIACLFLFLTVSLNLDLLGRIIMKNPIYREGLVVVPYLLLANLFLGVYYNLSVWFKLTDRTYFGTFISVGGALITILLNFLLIPYTGYIGSAITSLACYILMCLASYILGQKYYPVPYKIGNAALYLGIAIMLVLISRRLKFADSLLANSFNFLLLLVYVLFVFVFEKKQLNFKSDKISS